MSSQAEHEEEGAMPADPTSVSAENAENESTPSQPPVDQQQEDERYCWVCLATEEEYKFVPWVQPCNCRGATKWVHQPCLQRWVDEKQRGDTFKKIHCPQCQADYIILLPSMGKLANVLEAIDANIKRWSPLFAAGVIAGSIYWTAVTYGAVTVMQVVGHDEGMALLQRSELHTMLIGLPAIPIVLIAGRLFRWEDIILRFLRTKQFGVRKYPLLSLLLPLSNIDEEPTSASSGAHPHVPPSPTVVTSDPMSATRLLCGALLLPTISSVVGRAFFSSIKDNFQRAIVGGFVFVVVKGALKIYFKQKQHNRKKQRRILDYTEDNIRRYRVQQQQQQQHQQAYRLLVQTYRSPEVDDADMPALNANT